MIKTKLLIFLFFIALLNSGCDGISTTEVASISDDVDQTLILTPTTVSVPLQTPTPTLVDPLSFMIECPYGCSMFGTLSPDSKWLALDCADSTSDNWNIYVTLTRSVKWIPLFNEDEITKESPSLSFSPDGRYLAVSYKDRIVVFNTEDWSIERRFDVKMVYPRRDVFWTADSQSMAFFIEDEVTFLAQIDFDGNIKPLLNISDVFQGEKVLKPKDSIGIHQPSFSPDGKRMIYNSFAKNEDGMIFELWMLDLETGIKSKLREIDHVYVTPIWSPDGAYIALDQYNAIKLLEVSTLEIQTVFVKNTENFDSELKWTSDGSSLFFSATGNDNNINDIYAYDMEQKNLSLVMSGDSEFYYLLGLIPDSEGIVLAFTDKNFVGFIGTYDIGE